MLAPSGKTASSDHTTFVAIHSTEDDEGGHGAPVSSPTTAGSSTRSDSDHGLAASGSDALPIPAFPNDDNDEEHHGASEVVEAGGGGIAMGGSIKRARSSSSHHSSGLRTPLGATKPWPDLEDGHGGGGGGGHISSGLALLSPRSLGMECPPSPLRSDVDAGDVRSSVSQMLEDLLHLPRWQYRLMIGSIIFLFSSLVILIILSTLYGALFGCVRVFGGGGCVVNRHLFIYRYLVSSQPHPSSIQPPTGFMLNMSHVKVTAVELALPFPHVDKEAREEGGGGTHTHTHK